MVRCALPVFPSPGLGLKGNMCGVSKANARQKGSPLFVFSGVRPWDITPWLRTEKPIVSCPNASVRKGLDCVPVGLFRGLILQQWPLTQDVVVSSSWPAAHRNQTMVSQHTSTIWIRRMSLSYTSFNKEGQQSLGAPRPARTIVLEVRPAKPHNSSIRLVHPQCP